MTASFLDVQTSFYVVLATTLPISKRCGCEGPNLQNHLRLPPFEDLSATWGRMKLRVLSENGRTFPHYSPTTLMQSEEIQIQFVGDFWQFEGVQRLDSIDCRHSWRNLGEMGDLPKGTKTAKERGCS